MAGRFYVGPGTPGGGGLRIMKNPAHSPTATPRTDYDKFAFDSESGDLGYAFGINAAISGMAYSPMVVSTARIEAGDWWEMQGWVVSAFGSAWTPGSTGGGTPFRSNVSGSDASVISQPSFGVLPYVDILDSRYLVWQLPATTSGAPFPAHTGKIPRFYVNGPSNVIRLPRAGFAIDNPTVNNFILHENLRPAKVIAAGRVSLGAGSTLNIALPGNHSTSVFVGGQFSRPGAAVTIPYTTPVSGWGPETRRVQYRVINGGKTLQLREYGGNAVDVSYYVVAEDGQGGINGTGPILTERSEDGVSYMQVRRPGSASSSTRLADVLLDSRWQALPLVANGWIAAGSFSGSSGVYTANASIPSLGYKPLVLASWWLERYAWHGAFLERSIRESVAIYWNGSPFFDGYLGDTAFVTVSDGSLTFTNYYGLPVAYQWFDVPPPGPGWVVGWNAIWPSQSSADRSSYRTNWNDFVGVRYWVFAVPQG